MRFAVSPFKLSIFRQCPQKYKFHYIDKLANQFRIHRPYLTMGEHIHSALGDFYQIQPVQNRTLELLHKLLRKHWKNNREGFESLDDEKKWGEKALKLLENYYNNQDITQTPWKIEQMFEIPLNSKLTLMGKIDRLDEIDDGFLKIIDYKTGKPPTDNLEFLKEDLQLITYICIVTRKFNRPVKYAGCIYLETNQWVGMEPTENTLKDGLSRLGALIDLIQAEHDYIPRPNRLCNFCDFITICPAKEEINQLGFAKIKEEEVPF